MTELIISRGDTFPRSFLDTYRANRATEQFYNELTSSKSDELVLQNSSDPIQVTEEIHHGHSENLLDVTSLSPTKEDFLDKVELILPKSHRRRVPVYDRVDPEDSIRDIVTENDFYRFVLFKSIMISIYTCHRSMRKQETSLIIWKKNTMRSRLKGMI
ncbi:hypothetical protein NQ317_000131 [Molorchus minor]|uniref:Uncharacterized protein n=1 Tax=Molorchus minor TaxID=1323400 RepID=A0ABQ9JW02_9CUCU|nr:hypothetical protein NQ317_000131 [Molorchus minor]